MTLTQVRNSTSIWNIGSSSNTFDEYYTYQRDTLIQIDRSDYINKTCKRQSRLLIMSIYFNLGKMTVVTIFPDSMWNGLIKIGGILGLFGVVVSFALKFNQRRLNIKITDKIYSLQGNQSMKQKKKSFLNRAKDYVKRTPELTKTHHEV